MTHDTQSPAAVLKLVEQMADLIEDGGLIPANHIALTLRQSRATIRHLMCRCGHLSKELELAEADRDLYRKISYGSQKGGAA